MAMAKMQQHMVAVSMPAQGHLNPLMRFCKLLAKQPHGTPAAPPPHSLVRPVCGVDLSNGFNLSFLEFFHSLLSMAPDLEQLILSLNRHGSCHHLLSDSTSPFLPKILPISSAFRVSCSTQAVLHAFFSPLRHARRARLPRRRILRCSFADRLRL
ncbi:hypothetical protein GOP47_0012525 [Adiantum capillus-veneris]|uniref:Uncharacterized protein n=1 Tax=Adiantum capillus-veneris TaxID=13818 RepID=A0A9D4URB2_ADICA|nr:hypothetical protein GOP47_0012525 [Adiantum capillus-veneris]